MAAVLPKAYDIGEPIFNLFALRYGVGPFRLLLYEPPCTVESSSSAYMLSVSGEED